LHGSIEANLTGVIAKDCEVFRGADQDQFAVDLIGRSGTQAYDLAFVVIEPVGGVIDGHYAANSAAHSGLSIGLEYSLADGQLGPVGATSSGSLDLDNHI